VSRTSGSSKTTSRPPLYRDLVTTEQNTAPGTAIVPVLVYEDIEAAHDFLVAAFGFTSGGLQRDGNGNVIHGEVRFGQAAIWLHAVAQEHQMVSPRACSQSHGGLEIIVDDVDAHHARSRAAGADIEYPPADKPYGLREYGARDPESHRWWFSTPLAR
jgi:MerR family transcriptional regulator, thiopeptide resistance regulator